jgi:hypothetical protein
MTVLLTWCSSTVRLRPLTGTICTLPAGVHGMCSRDGKMSSVGPNDDSGPYSADRWFEPRQRAEIAQNDV